MASEIDSPKVNGTNIPSGETDGASDNKVPMLHFEKEEEVKEEREQWRDPMQFFMTILGFCVGLGHVWRFPYLCQQNGGGAFVIPFLIMLVLEGMPLLLLELGIGQKMRLGSLGVWKKVHPKLGGIGFGSTVIATVVGCYYNAIISWCFFYLVMSLRETLVWSSCPLTTIGNMTVEDPECAESSETKYFWYRQTLDVSESIEDPDGIRWWLALSLATAWFIVYLIVMRGIQSSGRVVYFTALFPYVVLTIFFVRGLTLPGAGAGLMHMFKPKMEMLLKPTVWLAAANQVFYSYGLAFGSIISFGSYNAPKTNCVRDVFQITACNAFTSVYACAVIFAILGFKAQHLFDKCIESDISQIIGSGGHWIDKSADNVTVQEYMTFMTTDPLTINKTFHGENALRNCSLERELDQAAEGTGLAFIVMPEVFTKLPGAPVWSVLFFMMLISLGMGSQIGILEGMISTLFEMPAFKSIKKPILTGVACLVSFMVGLVFTSGAGEYWLSLFDTYGAMGLTLIALVETMSVMYVYGHRKFTDDIHEMTGIKPGIYWQITWRFIAPVLLFVILVSSIVFQLQKTPEYSAWIGSKASSEKVAYPWWAMVFALTLAIASAIPIVTIAIMRTIRPETGSDSDRNQDDAKPALLSNEA